MRTATRNYGLDNGDGSTQTLPDLLYRSSALEVSPAPSELARWVGLAVVFTVLTGPITYMDQPHGLINYTPSSIKSITPTERQQRGQHISLSEARRMALQTLTDTERRLQEERAAEAHLMLSVWVEDEDINT